jgi:nicotinate-nucleotide adenylyltransferase
VATVEGLRTDHPGDDLFWIIGADTLPELPTWRRIDDVLDLIGFVTAARPGYDVDRALRTLAERFGDERARALAAGLVEMDPTGISSTEIRRRIREGRSIGGMVPDAVAEWIGTVGLYSDSR